MAVLGIAKSAKKRSLGIPPDNLDQFRNIQALTCVPARNSVGAAVLSVVCVCLTGCGLKDEPSRNTYQMLASSDGRIYRLNVVTGEMLMVEGSTYRAVVAVDTQAPNTIGKAFTTLPPGWTVDVTK